ncbi:DUF3168 domain-containing protein [Amorphus orientalis]|uniref:DUF3168 domain-containing protein n=1 Tax=Amorphus orientalis TaxID=649198 RepID=A0AAE4AWK1_9HYPH|nr:DUF3168 domain-containing protein [Amorphus orientalis]MDQ0317834.1 hypothetical protein [Amorphus orientalis]
MDAGIALQAAIHAELTGDMTLVSLLGGARIFDRPPRGTPHPFVSFAEASDRRMDGDVPPLREHRLSLEVHSTARGRKEASAIADRIEGLLAGAALALDGHRLVSLRPVDRTFATAGDRRSEIATLRFRAVTEPAQ